MRPSAEIDQVAQLVARELFAGLFPNQLDLEVLPLPREILDGFFLRNYGGLVVQVAGDQILHLGFDFLEILLDKAVGALEIVIEAVADCGADPEMSAGKKAVHRRRHQVRGAMAIDLQSRAGIGNLSHCSIRVSDFQRHTL